MFDASYAACLLFVSQMQNVIFSIAIGAPFTCPGYIHPLPWQQLLQLLYVPSSVNYHLKTFQKYLCRIKAKQQSEASQKCSLFTNN